MFRSLAALLSLLPVVVAAPTTRAADGAVLGDETLMNASDCALLFAGVNSEEAEEQREERVLRLVETETAERVFVSIEHTVPTWSTPRPMKFGEQLSLVEIVEESELDEELRSDEPETERTFAKTEIAQVGDGSDDESDKNSDIGEVKSDELSERDASSEQESRNSKPQAEQNDGRAAVFDLAEDIAGCKAGRYLIERDDTLGQGAMVLAVLPDSVLVDGGDSLLLMRLMQAARPTDVQLVWVSSFQLVIDESSKGLKSSTTKKKKRKRRKKKRKKKKKKKRTTRR